MNLKHAVCDAFYVLSGEVQVIIVSCAILQASGWFGGKLKKRRGEQYSFNASGLIWEFLKNLFLDKKNLWKQILNNISDTSVTRFEKIAKQLI